MNKSLTKSQKTSDHVAPAACSRFGFTLSIFPARSNIWLNW